MTHKFGLLTAVFAITLGSGLPVLHATTLVAVDGTANDLVSANTTITATNVHADASTYYRHVTMNGGAYWDITTGYSSVGTAPIMYGGATWVDTNAPDGTTNSAAVLASWRNNSTGSSDALRFYVSNTNNGITPEEAFGAALYAVTTPVGEKVSSLSVTGRDGIVGGGFTNTMRWVVQSGSNVYVSSSTFTFGSTTLATKTLSDVTADTWALWSPSSLSDLKFSSVSSTFNATVDWTAVSKIGYLWEMAATTVGNNTWQEFSAISATTVASMVPEPGTFGLIGGLAVMAFCGFRRRK